MNRLAIEAALVELKAQQSQQLGEARTQAIEAALMKLNELAPADINRTVGPIRQFIHSGDTCDIVITIQPCIFNVVVDWK
ncbi:MAG: hypothetical protein V4576_03315 [Patescibacteria group bacterium]